MIPEHPSEALPTRAPALSGSRSVEFWAAVGDGLDQYAAALTGFAGDLYACGSFSYSGPEPLNHIGRWDGSSWRAMGSGVFGPGWAMVEFQDKLYVGGSFARAGDKVSRNIGQWTNPPPSVAEDILAGPSTLRIGPCDPNPFMGRVSIPFSVRSPTHLQVTIVDPTGRRVASFYEGSCAGGGFTVEWNGVDDAGHEVAAGVYFAKVVSAEGTRATKVVRVK